MSELKVVSLEECLEKVIDYRGRTPKKLGKDWVKNGEYRAISANNVKFDGLIREESIYRGDEELYKLWMKEEVEKGDILLTSEAPSGQAMIWDSDEKIILSQRLYALRVNKNLVDNSYLKYFIQSPLGQKSITRNNSGSTVSGISAKTFKNIKILIPDLENQQAISKFLLTIDQKIQVNNQINQELEAMAKTLYDYWFVQFDFPDQNGKPYKSSGGKMVYNPELKREIPEGWGVEKIEDIAQTGSGGTPKSTNSSYYTDGEVPWINSGELSQTVITSTSNFITEEGLRNSNAKLFPSGTILVAMYGATAGKVSFLSFEASTNQAICAIMLSDVRMRYYLKNVIEDLYQYLVNLSTGSARDNLSQDMIKNIKVVIPSNEILDRYYHFSNNIIKELTKKQQENEQLTRLRDWLLPMLMNGQVKVE
ncbi:MAG: restriction endonuclease subunit S [Streptococcus parasanguinis]|nr:restriction endonuclease subunit S [Streptococcus parasanguinis]